MSLLPWLHNRFRTNHLVTEVFSIYGLSLVGVSRWDKMFLDAFFLA